MVNRLILPCLLCLALGCSKGVELVGHSHKSGPAEHNPAENNDVVLEAEKDFTVYSGLLEVHKKLAHTMIVRGFADGHKLFIMLPNRTQLFISRENYAQADEELRSLMEELVAYDLHGVWTYRPIATIQDEKKPAEYLLSKFAQDWAYRNSEKEGPNCFYAALASIFDNWAEPRFMSDEEFLEHIQSEFDEINGLQRPRDLLVLFSDSGQPEHAAVYVGHTQAGEKILFTKNGRKAGRYLFMDFDTITMNQNLYIGTSRKYFRRKQ